MAAGGHCSGHGLHPACRCRSRRTIGLVAGRHLRNESVAYPSPSGLGISGWFAGNIPGIEKAKPVVNGVPQAERELLAGAERRLGQVILLLVPPGTVVAVWQWGARMAVAFALGGVLAYLNYRWIVAIVDALIRAQKARVPRRAYFKLFLPLVLFGILLYVIFSRSWLSAAGVVGGLMLLVVAVYVEAVYEVFRALRE